MYCLALSSSSLSHESNVALVVIFIGFLGIAAFKHFMWWVLKKKDYSHSKKQNLVNKWGLLPYTALSIYSLMHSEALLLCASECAVRKSILAIAFLFLPALATMVYIATEVSFVQSAIIWVINKLVPGHQGTGKQTKARHRD